MSDVLLLVFSEGSEPPKSGLCALTAAKAIATSKGGSLSAVVIGKDAKASAEKLASFGLSKVSFAEGEDFEKYIATRSEGAVKAALEASGASILVSAATSNGKDLLPRLAASLDCAMASDIIGVNEDGTYVRPMYAGDVIATVRLNTDKQVVSVRTTAFDPAEAGGSAGSVEELSASGDAVGEVEGYELSGGDRPELGDAEVVVSGGRALGSEEKFQEVIYPLADAFGAAVGASRAAVDSGYAPNDWQVGQTGKIVAPNLYLAIGISGAIQHLAGMKDSKVIVAINKDEEAPIYEIADYGLVADLFEAAPELTEKVKAAKG